ncbi:hypothetical protein ACEPAF_6108 [Sanghuangporus sanghuang]
MTNKQLSWQTLGGALCEDTTSSKRVIKSSAPGGTKQQRGAPLPGPLTPIAPASAPPIATSSLFSKLQEPAPIIPSEEDKEEEEEEEEEHEMSLSKEAMTDLVTAVALALQAAGEGANQGSKASKKVHIAKPRDFDSEHNYVDFKQELHLYIYVSESEFRTNK